MNKSKFSIKRIPGWVVGLVFFGVLYATGLHTEAIGQVQRVLLATGLRNASVPESNAAPVDSGPETTYPGSGFRMQSLAGEEVAFESLKGKVVFLNIWATWCPPCVAEMPNIQSLYDKVKSDKIAFVMLSVDQGGFPRVRKFIDRKGFSFPVYMPATPLPEILYTQAIPTTFIISPEGEIVLTQEGMAEYDTPEMQNFLQNLAK